MKVYRRPVSSGRVWSCSLTDRGLTGRHLERHLTGPIMRFVASLNWRGAHLAQSQKLSSLSDDDNSNGCSNQLSCASTKDFYSF